MANGLRESEFVLHSYEGCSKVDFAKILQGFVQKQIPTAKVILHIDRDQKVDTDRHVIKLRDDCEKRDIIFFITKYQEIESYFCQPSHIKNIYDVSIEIATEKYKEFILELEEETKRKLTNFIYRERIDLAMNKDGNTDIEIVSKKVDDWYEEYGDELTPGKELLGKIKNYAQSSLQDDPNKIIDLSNALVSNEFKALLPETI